MANSGQRVSKIFPVLTLIGSVACSSPQADTSPSTGASGASSGNVVGASGAVTGAAAGVDAGVGASGADPGSDASNGGALGVACGSSNCMPPNVCCRAATGSTPTCVPADPAAVSTASSCPGGQDQLCATLNDCQQSGTATCVQGVCTDLSATDGGGAPPGDGGVAVTDATVATMNAVSDGGVPAGYPPPTPATYSSQCQATPLTAGLCPGGGTGPVCIQCLFGGSTYNNALTPNAQGTSEAGNYLVTVQLGGAAAGQTFISAESDRGLLSPVITAAGQSAEYAFVVNVREMEGQPNHAGGPGGYPGLDLFFSGPTSTPPKVSAVAYALSTAATKPVMVYIAGDSTVCDQTGGIYGGWGQMLPEFFAPPVGIANYANSGASSGSFMTASLWGAITSRWTAGDYVLIQFGHNDKGISDATVQANLEKYVTQAKAANVTPIIVSPPARANFSGSMVSDQSSLHAAAAQAAAKAQNVAYINLTSLSTAWYNMLGSQSAANAFHVDPTHTNLVGAAKLASLVAGNMKAQNLPLAKYLRP